MKRPCLKLALLACLVPASPCFALPPSSVEVLSFEDIPVLPEEGEGALPQHYRGFFWPLFGVANSSVGPAPFGGTGFEHGIVSGAQVAFTPGSYFPGITRIQRFTENFNYLGAYYTGGWNNGLQVALAGYRNGVQVYDDSFQVDAGAPLYRPANFLNIDELRLSSVGGVAADPQKDLGTHLVFDDFAYQLVPEPSGALLALGGIAAMKRLVGVRRATT